MPGSTSSHLDERLVEEYESRMGMGGSKAGDSEYHATKSARKQLQPRKVGQPGGAQKQSSLGSMPVHGALMWRPILLHVELLAPSDTVRVVPSFGSRYPEGWEPTLKGLNYGGSWLNVTQPCVEACDRDARCQAWTRPRPAGNGGKGVPLQLQPLTCKLFSQVGRDVLEARVATFFASGFKRPFPSVAPGPVREAMQEKQPHAQLHLPRNDTGTRTSCPGGAPLPNSSVAVCIGGFARTWGTEPIAATSFRMNVLEPLRERAYLFINVKTLDERGFPGDLVSTTPSEIRAKIATLGVVPSEMIMNPGSDTHRPPACSISPGWQPYDAIAASKREKALESQYGQLESHATCLRQVATHERHKSMRFAWVLYARADLLWTRPIDVCSLETTLSRGWRQRDFAVLIPRHLAGAVLKEPRDGLFNCSLQYSPTTFKEVETWKYALWDRYVDVDTHHQFLPAEILKDGVPDVYLSAGLLSAVSHIIPATVPRV